jgi:ribulose kinase
MDERENIQLQMDYYIGIDVGTGSARACIIDDKGDIVGLASENIGLWQPEQGYYVSYRLYLCLIISIGSNSASH